MSAPETFVHSQPVREAWRHRRHLSAPTAASCRQTCYCKTLRREPGKGRRRRRRRVEGSPASPAGRGVPGVLAEHPWGGGRPFPVPGVGLPEGSGHLVPISGVWRGAAQRLPSNPGSAFARRGGGGIFGAGGGKFGACLPKEAAGWQRVLVQGWGCCHPIPRCHPWAPCARAPHTETAASRLLLSQTLFGWSPVAWMWGYSWKTWLCPQGRPACVSDAPHRGDAPSPRYEWGQDQHRQQPVLSPQPLTPSKGLTGVPCVPAGCRVSVGARGRSPEQPAP